MSDVKLPLEGIIVLEFSQYLSGPSAGLRLADLGARVIKIERPGAGDACRKLAIKNLWADDGSSLLFHTINRNKESFAADLKNPDDLAIIKKLIAKADIITHNFRPGIMEKVGLDYNSAAAINPRIIYGEITGYGKVGPWKDKPGQDLLLQSLSGLVYASGNADENPMPFGIAVADIICGTHLVHGLLAALIRRHKTNMGAYIEASLLESLINFQFEGFTTFFAGGKMPGRSRIANGNPLLGAPYGIYATADGFIAIAMIPIQKLADAIDATELKGYSQDDAFSARDEIKEKLAAVLQQQSTAYWIEKLRVHDLWAMEVMDWVTMSQQEGYKVLEVEQTITTEGGKEIITTRCPIRLNGKVLYAAKPAPGLGADNERIMKEFIG